MAAQEKDVNAMFEKMGQKLGWFKHKDLDTALKSLSESTSKKPSKLRLKKASKKTTGKKLTGNAAIQNKGDKTSESKDFEVKASKPKTNISKNFMDLFSSDSDSSSHEDARRGNAKGDNHKVILQAASDSDEERQVCRDDTYVSCIFESPDRTGRPSLAPAGYDHRKSSGSFEYEETILKSRVSMATFSLDLDSIGDPLVESTRIHRRSSVTYKQMFSPEDSECSVDTSPRLQEIKDKVGLGKDACENDGICEELENLTLQKDHAVHRDTNELTRDSIDSSVLMDHNDTKYTTAIESFKELDDTRVVMEKEGISMEVNKNQAAVYKQQGQTKQKSLGVIDETSSSSGSEIEVIEVVDVATQTEEDARTECETMSELSTVDTIYNEDTVFDIPVYDQPTIYTDSKSDLQMTEVSSNLIEYEHSTIDKGEQMSELHENQNGVTEPVTSSNYNNTTNANESGSLYDQETMSMELMENSSTNSTESACNEAHGNQSLDSAGSEYSVIEVADIATQTESLPDSRNAQDNAEVNEIVLDHDADVLDQDADVLDHDADVLDHDAYVLDLQINQHPDNQDADKSVDEGSANLSAVDISNEKDECSIEQTDENKIDDDDDYVEDSSADLSEAVNSSPEQAECSAEKADENKIDYDNGTEISVQDDQRLEEGDEESDGGSVPEKKSSGNFSMLSSDSEENSDVDDNPLDFSLIRQKAERKESTESTNDGDKRPAQRLDSTTQSWRAERRSSSDSSDSDEKLEAFFKNLKKPEKEKKKSASEQSDDSRSLEAFIVEDEDVTSDSDDDAFHMRETLKMENATLAERLKRTKGLLLKQITGPDSDSDDDEIFSSQLYPDSVTKHKKQTIGKPRGTPRSWSLSSESGNSSNDDSPQPRRGTNDRKCSKPGNLKKTKNTGVTKMMNFSDISSDSESEPVPLFKTPNPIRKTKKVTQNTGKENKPIQDRRDNKSLDEDKGNKGKTPKSKTFSGYISLSDGDSDDDSLPSLGSISSSGDTSSTNVSSTNVSSTVDSLFKLPTPAAKGRQPRIATPLSSRGSHTYNFLRSLSSVVEDESRRHPEAERFVRNFKKKREEITANLFSLYNRTIFEGKLPTDLSILWNKRLLRTAGYCAYKRNQRNQEDRTARVELSTKVCDSAERVRDTLVHELCHAAVWLLNGVNGGHGPFWKYWARQANKVHPELPAIGRCHSYSISTKFTYRCTRCGYSIGRHSKSLNTEKKVCGHCHGTFELIQNETPTTPRSAASSAPATPRTPNRFALFVKEHYNVVKQKDNSLKHGDVMKELSKLFAVSKITN